MAINIGANFAYQGKQPNFERDRFITKAEMKAFAETSVDEGYLSYCAAGGNMYQFKATNSVDATTGKWRVFKSGNQVALTVDSVMSDTSTNPVQNKVIKNYVFEEVYNVSEGLQATNNALTDFKTSVASTYAKKTDISTVYKYKGTKATYAELPTTDNTTGDVWNITNADSSHSIKAGDNVVWTGEAWDNLSGTVDLSAYATKTEINNIFYNKNGVILFSDAKYSEIKSALGGKLPAVIDCNGHGLALDTTVSGETINILNGTVSPTKGGTASINIINCNYFNGDSDGVVIENSTNSYINGAKVSGFIYGSTIFDSTVDNYIENCSLYNCNIGDTTIIDARLVTCTYGSNSAQEHTLHILNADIADGAITEDRTPAILIYSNNEAGYTLPVATTTALGGVIIGNNLSVDSTGKVSVSTSTTVGKGDTKPVTSDAVASVIDGVSAGLSACLDRVSALETSLKSLQTTVNAQPKQVVLTQAAYDALTTKDSNTIYYING